MSRLKRATLTDVARRAGVSVTTASYILNGRTAQMRISASTERRVKAAIHDLGYRPNLSARTLRGSTTRTIGLISDFVASGAFSGQLLSGAIAAARRHDHLLVTGETLGDPDAEALLLQEMTDRQVDGIVYATLSASAVRLPDSLRGGRTVLLNCQDPARPLPSVMADDLAAGAQAATYLVHAGVRGPVHVVGLDVNPDATAGRDRLRGIVGALEQAPAEFAGVVPCLWDVEPAYWAVKEILREGARPEALICLNDRIAFGAYQALEEAGLAIPADVAVISFDGSELASWLRPRLTSLALPFAQMGARAVELLMDPSPAPPDVTRLPLVLEEGGSVLGAAPMRERRSSVL